MANLTLYFTSRLNRQEQMALNMLWAVVFGSEAGGDNHYHFNGSVVRYSNGDPAMLEKMKRTLETKPWEQPDFLTSTDPATQKFVKAIEGIEWFGVLVTNLRSLHGKLFSVLLE